MKHDPLCNTLIGLPCNCMATCGYVDELGERCGLDPASHTHAPRGTAARLRAALAEARTMIPTDSEERKNIPMATGLLDYFPAALAEVARLSKAANDKHNPGEDMHWSRGKSSDHADTILRHLAERGIKDTDGFYHDVKVAWRALAQLQELLEEKENVPLSRASRMPAERDV